MTSAPFGEFVAKATLARSWRARNPDHLCVAVLRTTERALERGELAIAAAKTKSDWRRETDGSRRRASTRAGNTLRSAPEVPSKRGVQRTHVAIWPDQPVAVFAQTYGAGLGHPLQPTCQMNRQPVHPLLSGRIRRENTRNQLARMQADTNFRRTDPARYLGLHRKGSLASQQRMALLRKGGTEQHHDPVAEHAYDGPIKRPTVAHIAATVGFKRSNACSASRPAMSSVDPTMSANMTVAYLRSPSGVLSDAPQAPQKRATGEFLCRHCRQMTPRLTPQLSQ